MLPAVAVEALLFLGRRDLDKMCAISTWLDALMAVTCATYPYRRVHRVHLMTSTSTFDLSICENEGHETAFHSSDTLDEALTFLAPVCSRGYVDEFEVELGLDGRYCVSPHQWTLLTNIFRSGAARHLWLRHVDLSALYDDALVDAVRCRKLELSSCNVRGKLFSDDVLRSCAANGVLETHIWANKSDEAHTVSEDALLEFCFPPDGPSSRDVSLDNLTTPSDTFAVKIFERLLAPTCTSGPCGFIVFAGKQEQRGLADYVQHLMTDQRNPTYRFASLRKGDLAYHVVLDYRNREYSNPAHRNKMEFSFGYMDLRPTNDDQQDDDVHDDDDDEQDTE